MKSARAVFFVTDRISAGSSAQKEFQTGKNGVDAALEVWHSTLPHLPLPFHLSRRECAHVRSGGVQSRGVCRATLLTACVAVSCSM